MRDEEKYQAPECHKNSKNLFHYVVKINIDSFNAKGLVLKPLHLF